MSSLVCNCVTSLRFKHLAKQIIFRLKSYEVAISSFLVEFVKFVCFNYKQSYFFTSWLCFLLQRLLAW